MVLRKFGIIPDSSSYVVTDGEDAIFTKLDGGLGRYRLDKVGASKTVECQFSLTRSEYSYFRSFYDEHAMHGGNSFLIDLVIDDSGLEEHQAFIKPGDVQLSEQVGLLYVVSMTLEVKPVIRTSGYNVILVAMFDAYGSKYDIEFASVASKLEVLVNTTLPAI